MSFDLFLSSPNRITVFPDENGSVEFLSKMVLNVPEMSVLCFLAPSSVNDAKGLALAANLQMKSLNTNASWFYLSILIIFFYLKTFLEI